ncbi:hypothetical protein [Dorea longicatena]|uniref:hypothetical protein n=1 Tax=Dorea longicatena TaxID=88431 RepID=UPI001FAC9824|nr:hypothetical protein [Dorea longicatena]
MKQCSKSENVLIIDSDYEEADGFIKGVREVTGEEWQVALHENNKIYGWRRYVRFFTVALQTVLSGKKYEGKTVLCWQQFYGIAIAFFQRMFHMKKRYKLVIMTFIYKEKRGLAGKLFYRFVRYAVTSRYVDKIILTTQSEKPMYQEIFGVEDDLFAFARWTAIMIYDGALAADGVMHTGRWIWCLVIGALIILWIVIGITNLGKINTVAMAALFILTLILCKVIFTGSGVGTPSDDSMTFGAAVELAVAMPLSWLPLISDYTREAKEPVKATAVSAVTYGIVSCWMYVIGMGAAIITGEYDIAQIMLKAGLGILGLLIIVFSTVTTTFLDAYSAGISSETVVSRWNGKHVAIVVTVIGTAAAIVYPMDNITDFLYLIGSVFAPMIAIQIADFFLLKQDKSSRAAYVPNMIIWVIGFVAYRILMNVDMPVGNTLPDMVITIILCLIAGKLIPEKNQKK